MHDLPMPPSFTSLIRGLVVVCLCALHLATGARAASAAGPAAAGGGADGAALYAKYCALCHGPEAKGYAADNAPSLVSPQFLSGADDAFIANSIALGRPNTSMAAYGSQSGGPLSNADVDAIVTFLRSHGPAHDPLTKHPAGTVKRGAALYGEHCRSCHGDRSAGGNAIHLANPTFLSLASDEFLYDAIARGRDGTPMKPFAKELDAEEIADIVAYLRTWAVGAPKTMIRPRDAAAEGPAVLNPDGKPPELTMREDRFVPAAEVKQALADKRRMVIVDARVSSDWDREHIAGAISVPYYALAGLDRIPNDGTWVLAYCACPHHASGVVVDELRKRGYPHTAVIDEGVLVWKERGYPMAGADVATTDAR